MKKYIIIALCIINYINGMEQQPQPSLETIEITKTQKQRKRQDFDVEAYNKYSEIGVKAFVQWLRDSKIDMQDKNILNIECRTGNISEKLVDTAAHVHGVDINKNMIEFAQNKFGNNKTLSFEHIEKIKHFKAGQQYDATIAPFCMNYWNKNTEKILRNTNRSLKMKGDFFTALLTNENRKPFNYTAGEKLIKKYFTNYLSMEQLTGFLCLSNEEIKNLFNEIGFEIINIGEQSTTETVSKDRLVEEVKCLARTTPLMKFIPDKAIQKYSDKYVEFCIEDLLSTGGKETNKDEYTYTWFCTSIHARKVKDV